jgi:chaperone modulatory protein CbpM
MKLQPHEWAWLDTSETIDAADLSRACGITAAELDELVGYGAVKPLEQRPDGNHFSAGCLGTLRHACKVRQDFDLDIFTVALLVEYLNRIDVLQREVRYLHAHLPPHAIAATHREGPRPWVEQHGKADAGEPWAA